MPFCRYRCCAAHAARAGRAADATCRAQPNYRWRRARSGPRRRGHGEPRAIVTDGARTTSFAAYPPHPPRARVNTPTGSAAPQNPLTHRYEAYNSLHSLANAYRKPFEVPAVVVVGAQSAGKSALVEALMGFQFNEVGGGTRTRRPIALQMHYNAACDEPAVYIMDERFVGGEPVADGAPHERRATLAEARRFIEEENRRLERDAHRSFEAREIVIRVEYRHCPNLVLVDTPGLVGDVTAADEADDARDSPTRRNLKLQAREAYELALSKAKQRSAILLCIDDHNDWGLASAARRLCADADPTLARTVVVNTKLDTKLVQFSGARDIMRFLRAGVLGDLHPRLLAGPFFTSVPCGRVASPISTQGDVYDRKDDDEAWFAGAPADDGVAYRQDAEFRAAVARAARADASLVRAKLGHQGFGTVQDRLGVHALRRFLEKHVERQYRANVARVVPLLRQERQATEAALKAADEELAALTPERLRRSAEAVADKFCRSLGAAVAGSVAAETNIYGERLADERVSGGAFLAPVETLVEEEEDEEDSGERVLRGGFFPTTTGRRTPGVRAAAAAFVQQPDVSQGKPTMELTLSQTALDGAVGHADAALYGGAQYRRALREFALAVRHLSLPSVGSDEIANALGVGDAHDGADFVRASCVIAVDKARRSFEPQLRTLAHRVSHVMRRLPPALERMMELQGGTPSRRVFSDDEPAPSTSDAVREARGGPSTLRKEADGPYEAVMRLVASIYDKYVLELADRAVARCRDDLEAMTRFVTWDLASSSDATSSMAAALEPTPDLAQNVQADMAAARSALDNPRSSKKSKARRWFSARDESAVEAAIVDDWRDAFGEQNDNVDVLKQTLATPIGSLSPVTPPHEVVGSLVRRIAAAWREHFARTVAVKFNCFFLMPFVDDFPLYLREHLDDEVNSSEGCPDLFDVARARAALEKRRDDLANELAANAKLCDTFDEIQRACVSEAFD
jgi:GTPase SAR1 family protein